MDEVLAGNPDDLLYKWIREPRNRDALVLDENPNPPLIQKIVNEGYGKDLSDHELEQIGQDPFLVAHAMTSLNRCVVTTETSAPSKLRQNRKLPDVCTSFGVSCCDTFKLIRELKFTTSWDQQLSPSITETFQQELKLISKNDDWQLSSKSSLKGQF